MRTATSQELWEVRYVHSGTDGAEWAEPLKGIGGICHPPPLDCAAACKLARMDAGIRSNIDRPDTGTKASRWVCGNPCNSKSGGPAPPITKR